MRYQLARPTPRHPSPSHLLLLRPPHRLSPATTAAPQTTAPTTGSRGITSSSASSSPSASPVPDPVDLTPTPAGTELTPQPDVSSSFTRTPISIPGVVPDAADDDDDDTATPSPAEDVALPSPAPVAGESCADGESFQIFSAAFPVVQGCFQAASALFSTPGTTIEAWSVDGTVDPEQIIVIGLADDGADQERRSSFRAEKKVRRKTL